MLFLKRKCPIKLVIKENELEIAKEISEIIIKQVSDKPHTVLGLATGSSPLLTYQCLVEDYKKNKTDYSKIVTFNLDEYIDLDQKFSNQSFENFMNINLFNKINIKKENTFFPLLEKYKNLKEYDQKIKKFGGIDLQILGLGVNGHIAFNEPLTPLNSTTHTVDITEITRQSNAKFFDNNYKNVPRQATTVGLKTILKARKIILIATGVKKADAIEKLFSKCLTLEWPCTVLQYHSDVTVYVDPAAASKIKAN